MANKRERIFLATLGMVPAVVTETLWALAQRRPSWVPDRIEVITTNGGVKALRDQLLIADGPFASLYPRPASRPPVQVFVPIRDIEAEHVRYISQHWNPLTDTLTTDGNLAEGLVDIDDAEAAICMGDLILERVHAATRSRGNQLHLSITGGRKTMSAHALFSLGLVGNPQDEASHVLMGPEFENNRQFRHPDQGGLIHTIEVQNRFRGKPPSDWPAPTLDPRNAAATLRLFAIAAPRFDHIPHRGKSNADLPRLSTIIGQMNLAGDWLRAPKMDLNPGTNTVTVCGRMRVLDPTDFFWLRVLATSADESWTSPRDSNAHTPGAITGARLLFGKPGYTRLDDLRDWYEQALSAGRSGGDEVKERAARRSEQLLGMDNVLGENSGRNLTAWILDWKSELSSSAGKSAEVRLLTEGDVVEDIVKLIGSFTELREHLAAAFGSPLAEAMLPKRTTRPRKVKGVSQAAYELNGARPGFLTLNDAQFGDGVGEAATSDLM